MENDQEVRLEIMRILLNKMDKLQTREGRFSPPEAATFKDVASGVIYLSHVVLTGQMYEDKDKGDRATEPAE